VVAVEIYSGASASGTPVQTLSASVSGGSWSATASRLADGRYTVRAKQSDAPGNTGYSAQRTFTVDTTPPAVTLTTPAGGSYTNHTTPAVSGTAEMASGDSNVTVKIFAGSVATGTPVQSLSATAQLDGTWTVNASTLAEGTYTARAQQSDAANNTGTSAAHTFTIDTTPPHTSIISGPSASSTATSATFSFTASETGSTFECRLDGSAWKSCTSPAAYAALAVGKHTFDVRATDLAGNTEPIPATSSWTVTAPSPGTTPPPTTTTPPTAATLRVTLTANSKQRLARRRKLSVQVRCTGACSLFLSGKLSLVAKPKHAAGRTRRALVLNRMLAIKLPAAKSVKVTLKLPAKVRAAITAALARHARVTLTLSALASAPGVKSANARVTIRLLR
jgi:hypothetical protein